MLKDRKTKEQIQHLARLCVRSLECAALLHVGQPGAAVTHRLNARDFSRQAFALAQEPKA